MRHNNDPTAPACDAHCHQIKEGTHWQIISLDTDETAFNKVGLPIQAAKLNKQSDKTMLPDTAYFSIGIHPWFLDPENADIALEKLKSYRHHPKLLAIGECGLDKTIATDMSVQTAVFRQQIELAEQWRKPLIIHCVRACNELIHIKKSLKTKLPWVVHGFNKNPELAKQLLKQGCYLSLGKDLLRERSNAAQIVQQMPLDRLLLETDDACDLPISAIYAAAAKITGLATDTLRQQIFSNFKRVFLND